jgi:hypothetical protein
MVGLWPLLSQAADRAPAEAGVGRGLAGRRNPSCKKMLADFRKEEFLQHADFDTPYKEARPAAPGRGAAAGDDVDATPAGQRPAAAEFQRAPPNGDSKPRSFQMEMQPKLMQGLMHLLDQACCSRSGARPSCGERAEPARRGDGSKPRY